MKDAIALVINLAVAQIRHFYDAYPVINRPRELCAYYKSQNKHFQVIFIMFVVGMLFMHAFADLAMLLDGFDHRQIALALLIQVLVDVPLILVSALIFHIGKAASTGKKGDIATQEKVRTKFKVCGYIPTCVFILSALGVLGARDKYVESSIVWLLYTGVQILLAVWNIGGVIYRVSTVFVFSVGYCYLSYFMGFFTDYFAERVLVPTILAVVATLTLDRYTKENFLLRHAMRHQRNMYQNFFQQIQDPVMIFSGDALLYQNHAATSTLGTTHSNYYSKLRGFVSSRGWTLEDYVKAWLDDEVSEFMGTSAQQERYQWNCDGGATKRIVKVTLIESSDMRVSSIASRGEVTGKFTKKAISLFMHDITEELHNEGTKEKEKFKNILLFSLSHELKTPLNIFQRFLGESKRLVAGGDESAKDLFLEAKGAWRYLRNKINDILDYAEMLSKEFAMHNSCFSTLRFIGYLRKVTSFLLAGKRKSVKLDFKMGETVPDPMYGDRDRLEQILFNFLSNAAKFTDSGTISLNVTRQDERPGESYIGFSVRDTGCGMQKETVERLFTPRRDGPGSPSNISSVLHATKSGRKATRLGGLGLTVSRMICERLGCEIHVTSEPKRGSTFSFRIPLRSLSPQDTSLMLRRMSKSIVSAAGRLSEDSVPDEDVASRCRIPQPESLDSFPLHPQLIPLCDYDSKIIKTQPLASNLIQKLALVVDDNEFNRDVAERMIRKFGFRAVPAENGSVAIEALRGLQEKAEPATKLVVFMDVDMPVMDGIEATMRIRNEDKQPRPIIVALTAFCAETERRKCFDAGMDYFIGKPLTRERLREVLCNACMD